MKNFSAALYWFILEKDVVTGGGMFFSRGGALLQPRLTLSFRLGGGGHDRARPVNATGSGMIFGE